MNCVQEQLTKWTKKAYFVPIFDEKFEFENFIEKF